MELRIVTKNPEIDTVPYYELFINYKNQYIEFDDINEKRWKIEFKTVQAWKVTAFDCINLELLDTNETVDEKGINHHYILEVVNSHWIKELEKELYSRDKNATFFEKSHHYILPLGDEIIEVIAWDNYKLEQIVQ